MSLLTFFSKERPANEPGIIENLRKKTHDKITNLIGPFAQVQNWVKDKLGWLFSNEKTEHAADKESTNEKPQSETPPEQAVLSPVAQAEHQHRSVLDNMLKGFEMVSQSPEIMSLRHADGKENAPQRTAELDILARSRFDHMQTDGEKWLEEQVKKMTEQKKSPEEIEQFRREREGGYLLKHDDEWLKKHQCAENILNGYYSSGREIAQAFLGSDKHRQNILGTYKDMGLAIEPLKDIKTGKQMYFVVCLYKNGVQHPDKVPPPAQVPQISEESREGLLPAYLDALGAELMAAGIETTYQKDEELTKKIANENEIHRGTFVARFEADGKVIHYLVSQTPPLFMRLNQEGKPLEELLPQEVVADFQNALGGVPQQNEVAPDVDSSIMEAAEAEPLEKDSEVIGLS